MDNFTLQNKIVSLIGKRNSGKSQMLRYLVSLQRPLFKKIFVICPTETVNNFYKDMVAKENIYDQYNEVWIDSLIKKMTEVNSGKSKKRFFSCIINIR